MHKVIRYISGISLLFPLVLQASNFWDGGGGTTEWGDAANWNPNGVPGSSSDPYGVLQLNQVVTVNSAVSTANHADIYVRRGASLTVKSNMNDIRNIALGITSVVSSGGGKISHTAGTITASNRWRMGHAGFFGNSKALYLLSGSGQVNAADLDVYDGGYLSLSGSNCGIAISDDLSVDSKGVVRFIFDSVGVSQITVSDTFTVDPSASLHISASAYTGGEGIFELVKYNSLSGSFSENKLSLTGLDESLIAYLEYDSDSMNLVFEETSDDLAAVLALGDLTTAPAIFTNPATPGTTTTVSAGNTKYIYYDGLDYEGQATRVFAWIGIPAGSSSSYKVPGIVLVHGGGGTAYKDWVNKWVARGYAAVSIAVEGHTSLVASSAQIAAGNNVGQWYQHAMAGPARVGIYGDSNANLEDQWMYHAVADAILANSLLLSLPMVDSDNVGIMGISWGGVITSTAIGIDTRFKFAIPTYGCGHLYDSNNWYETALANNQLYQDVWDPMIRMSRATMPTMWFSWPQEANFSLLSQSQTYNAASGVRMVSLIPNLGHGHGAAWSPLDSYEFADSVVSSGSSWCTQKSLSLNGRVVTGVFDSSKTLDQATLISTTDTDEFTGDRTWVEVPATLVNNGNGLWTVTATLPVGYNSWFVNVHSGTLQVSSDYQD